LDTDLPTVTVTAEYSKRRREDTLPLRPELANELRLFLARHAPAAPAFPRMPEREHVAEMFRADVEAAGIAYRDEAGLVADFHALRHTFISNLARGGVHPKTAQALARHSTITLTMDRYSHTLVEEQSAALAALPNLSRPAQEALRATGTDPAVLASCLALSGRFQATSVDRSGKSTEMAEAARTPENAEKNAVFQGNPSGEDGIRTPREISEKTVGPSESGARSGALAMQSGPIDPDLASVIDAWPTLPEAIRAGILAMIRAAGA
jgi:hypothetical protein